MIVRLVRHAYLPVGTFGRLWLPGFDCWTVERPWKNNRRNVSCFPIGTYDSSSACSTAAP